MKPNTLHSKTILAAITYYEANKSDIDYRLLSDSPSACKIITEPGHFLPKFWEISNWRWFFENVGETMIDLNEFDGGQQTIDKVTEFIRNSKDLVELEKHHIMGALNDLMKYGSGRTIFKPYDILWQCESSHLGYKVKISRL